MQDWIFNNKIEYSSSMEKTDILGWGKDEEALFRYVKRICACLMHTAIWFYSFSISFKGLSSLHCTLLESLRPLFHGVRQCSFGPASLRTFLPTPDTGFSFSHNLLSSRKTIIVKDKKIFANGWTVWKGKKIWHWRMNAPGQQVPITATGEEWRNNTRKNEEMEPKQKKKQKRTKNKQKQSTQLWMWLVIEVKSDAVKSNIA